VSSATCDKVGYSIKRVQVSSMYCVISNHLTWVSWILSSIQHPNSTMDPGDTIKSVWGF